MMRYFFILFLLSFMACSKKHSITRVKTISDMSCSNESSCSSSISNKALAFKFVGNSGDENMAYLLKIAQTIPKAVVVNISNNHFTLTKGNVVIDFFTSNDAKVIHYKSQRSKSSLFSGDDSKVIIEDIRFRFFQRNL